MSAALWAMRMAAEIKVGNLEGVRDYGDVRDVVRAYRLLLERGKPGEAYNVCTGRGHIMRHLLDTLCSNRRIQADHRPGSHAGDPLAGLRFPRGRSVEAGAGERAGAEISIEKTLEDLYREARERVRRETGS